MSLLTILEYPDPRLLIATKEVTAFDADLAQLVADMFETMYASQGAGLAAIQVNVHKNMFVMDVSRDCSAPQVIINPKILRSAGEQVSEEGCLSFPGLTFDVMRPKFIELAYQDLQGRPQVLEAEDFMAKCVHHELEHASGKVFIQNLSSFKRDRLLKKWLQSRTK